MFSSEIYLDRSLVVNFSLIDEQLSLNTCVTNRRNDMTEHHMKRHSLLQIKKTNFTLLKLIHFHFKAPAKQMLVCFRTRQGKKV